MNEVVCFLLGYITSLVTLSVVVRHNSNRNKWISVDQELPDTNSYNESELLQCYDADTDQQFVGFYIKDQRWVVFHHHVPAGMSANVTHYSKLRENPKL